MLFKIIITSLLSTTFIVSIIAFLIKKSYEKILDKKLESFKEELRQKSKVYDNQFSTYHILDTMIYKVRNKVRDILDILNENPIDHNNIEDDRRILDTYTSTIIELLYENRILLTDSIFKQLHDLKNLLIDVDHIVSNLRTTIIKDDDDGLKRAKDNLISKYKLLDTYYININDYMQKSIKVK